MHDVFGRDDAITDEEIFGNVANLRVRVLPRHLLRFSLTLFLWKTVMNWASL